MKPENYIYDINFDQTEDYKSIAEEVILLQKSMFPEMDSDRIRKLFNDVSDLFLSRSDKFQGMKHGYHSLSHTLQTTLCLCRMLFNRHFLDEKPILTSQKFFLGISAILMHDVGFLKEQTDTEGTGAKYSFAQETRSCQFARYYAQEHGWDPIDIWSIESLIYCTGPRSILSKFSFLDSIDELLGYCICTSDFLGQMSDPKYVEKLYTLYEELNESDEFRKIPIERRRYKSAIDLLRKTPGFWLYVFKTKLTRDCKSVYKFLSNPYPDGKNPYIEKVEENIQKVKTTIHEVYNIPILIGG